MVVTPIIQYEYSMSVSQEGMIYSFIKKTCESVREINCTMGNVHHFFTFLNCPLAKKEVFHFTS